MRKGNTYLIGIASIALVGLIVYIARRTKRGAMLERLEKIADEGYELAHDVLYPIHKANVKALYPVALPQG